MVPKLPKTKIIYVRGHTFQRVSVLHKDATTPAGVMCRPLYRRSLSPKTTHTLRPDAVGTLGPMNGADVDDVIFQS